MKVLLQWTRLAPQGWEEIESSAWAALPKGDVPDGSETLSNDPLWIYRLNVQGVEFTADHYAVEHVDATTTRVTIWNDDPDDYPVGERFARVWTFRNLRADSRLGGAINTEQSQEIFADTEVGTRFAKARGITFKPFTDFVPPSARATRHGLGVSTRLNEEHDAARSVRGWREWTEGLDAAELGGNGQVKSQRLQERYSKNTGTKTFILRGGNAVTSVHTSPPESSDRNFMSRFLTRVAETLGGQSIGGDTEAERFLWLTTADEPNDAAWPTGNYRCQLDVVAAGADITYGLLDQGIALGHFARINSGASSDLETKQQVEGAFAGTGLKLATTGSVSWSTGAAGDRFECLVSNARPASHGNESIDIDVWEADHFADGPWPSELDDAVAVTDAVAVEMEYGRVISDTVAVTDQVDVELISPAGLFQRTVNDTVAVTDALVAEAAFERTVNDTVAVTDALAVTVTFERSATDAVSAADNASWEFDPGPHDDVVVADAIAREHDAVRDEDDTIVVVDQTSPTWSTAITEGVAVVDAVTAELCYARTISDVETSSPAVLLARYLLDEASSGTSPTEVADDSGNGHNLTIDYGAGDAAWTSDGDGNGLDFTDIDGTAIAAISDMSGAGSIGDSLNGLKEASLIVVARVDATLGLGSRLIHLGSDSGNGELDILFVTAGGGRIFLRFGRETDGGDNLWNAATLSEPVVGGSKVVIHAVFNSAESIQDDRAKLWINGLLQAAPDTSSIPQDETLDTANATDSFCIGNRVAGNAEVDGAVFFVEVYSGILSADQISASANRLALNHDVDWNTGVDVTDTVAAELCFERSAADTVSVVDALATATTFERTISDTVSVVDALATATTFERTISDAALVTDSVVIDLQGSAKPFNLSLSGNIAASGENTTAQLIAPATKTTGDFGGGRIQDDENPGDTVDLGHGEYREEEFSIIANADAVEGETYEFRIVLDGEVIGYSKKPQWTIAEDLEVTINDTVAVADAIGREHDAVRDADDNIVVVDQTSPAVDIAVTVTEAVAVADNASWEFDPGPHDDVVVADAIGREHDAVRDEDDTIVVVDQTSPTFSTAITEGIAIVDQLVVEVDYVRAAADTVSVVDNASWEFDPGPHDDAAVADAIAREHDAVRDADDNIVVVDNTGPEVGISITEAVAVADTIAREHDANRPITDVAAVADTAFTNVDYERQITDSVSVVDQVIVEKEIGATINDVVAVADAIAREHDAVRDEDDNIVVVDQTTPTVEASITEAVAVADAVTANMEFERSATDVVAVADQATWAFEPGIDADALVVGDAIAREHDAVRDEDDNIVVVDQTNVEKEIGATITEAVAVVDAVTANMEFERAIIDTAVVGDAIGREHDAVRDADDNIVAVDQTNVEKEIAATITEAIAVADAIAREHDAVRDADDNIVVVDQTSPEVGISITEAVAVADAAFTNVDYSRTLADSVAVADAVVVETFKLFTIVVADAAVVADAIAREHDAVRDEDDTIVVVDQTTPEVGISITEAIAAVDAAFTNVDYLRTIDDVVAVVDDLTVEAEGIFEVDIDDNVAVVDQVLTAATFERIDTNVVVVVDQTDTAFEAAVSDIDTIAVADAVTVELFKLIVVTVADSVSVVDSLVIFISGFVVDDVITVDDTASITFEPGIAEDVLATADLLLREVCYVRPVNDAVVATDIAPAEGPRLAGTGIEYDLGDGPLDVTPVGPPLEE